MSRTVSHYRRRYNTLFHAALRQEPTNSTRSNAGDRATENPQPRRVNYPRLSAAAQLFASYKGHQQFEAEFIATIFMSASQNLDDFKSIVSANGVINTLFNSTAHDMKGFNPLITKTPKEKMAFEKYISDTQTQPSLPFLKAFLGRCISISAQANRLTHGNCGFASACLVVIEELNLTNIKQRDLDKIINAANFSTGLFDRASAIEARREKFRTQLTRRIADDLKATADEIPSRSTEKHISFQ